MSFLNDISSILAELRTQTRLAGRFRDDVLRAVSDQANAAKTFQQSLDRLVADVRAIRDAFIPKPAVGGRILIDGRVMTVPIQLQDIQTVTATFQFTDADGNPTSAPAGVVPQWSSSDVTKATVAAAPDGMSAVIAGQPVLGDVQIAVSAPGTTPLINASDIVTIVPGPPAGGKIAFGTPKP